MKIFIGIKYTLYLPIAFNIVIKHTYDIACKNDMRNKKIKK